MSHNRTKFVSVPGVPMTSQNPPINAADAMLRRMKQVGVDYLFANGGTDFPPILEAYAQGMQNGVEMPEPLTIPHENVAMGMAHGYYLATGRAQAVMVHVNVGLANTTMGAINAASDNIPLMLMSGRTPPAIWARVSLPMRVPSSKPSSTTCWPSKLVACQLIIVSCSKGTR